MKQIKM
jgi:hypothetical protein